MRLTVLDSDLYPDASTVRAACEALAMEHHVTTLRITPETFDEADWDRLLELILESDRCMSI